MAVKYKDYYDVLGVDKNAKEDDVRQAYRKLARQHHPDVNPGDKSAEERFKDINEAYEVLSDPEKRRQYDQLGSNWRAGSDFTPPPGSRNGNVDFGGYSDFFSGGGGSGDFSDFFEGLFGQRGGARAGRGFRMGGRDIEAEIGLTLQDAHRGGTRTITFQATETCPDCKGTGLKDGKTCPTCRGSGRIRRQRTLDVTIPPGVRDGSVIRLAGQGEPGANGEPAGDLLLRVRVEPDPVFKVVGQDDVEVELPVAPWEAALGQKITVPTLDGPVEMTIPAGAQADQRLRLRGKGLRKRGGGGRGDQYVKLKIVMPPKLTAKEKELFAKLAAESRFNPR
jgi:DnaJ-class molecular chaperone